MEWIMTFQKQLRIIIIPTDEVHHFSEGRAQPPTRRDSTLGNGREHVAILQAPFKAGKRHHKDTPPEKASARSFAKRQLRRFKRWVHQTPCEATNIEGFHNHTLNHNCKQDEAGFTQRYWQLGNN